MRIDGCGRWFGLGFIVIAVMAMVSACVTVIGSPAPNGTDILPPASSTAEATVAPEETPESIPTFAADTSTPETVPPETPAPNPTDTPAESQPPGAVVRLSNLTDTAYDVRVFAFVEGRASEQFGIPLAAADLASEDGLPTGVFRLIFEDHETDVDIGTCDFELTADDTYDFVILDSGVAIARASATPTSIDDLLVASSPLCHATPAT